LEKEWPGGGGCGGRAVEDSTSNGRALCRVRQLIPDAYAAVAINSPVSCSWLQLVLVIFVLDRKKTSSIAMCVFGNEAERPPTPHCKASHTPVTVTSFYHPVRNKETPSTLSPRAQLVGRLLNDRNVSVKREIKFTPAGTPSGICTIFPGIPRYTHKRVTYGTLGAARILPVLQCRTGAGIGQGSIIYCSFGLVNKT